MVGFTAAILFSLHVIVSDVVARTDKLPKHYNMHMHLHTGFFTISLLNVFLYRYIHGSTSPKSVVIIVDR